MPSDGSKPGERQGSTSSASPKYQSWSPGLKGEFTYQGLQDGPGGPAMVWQQGETLFAQPATPKAQQAARDVELGDSVVFYQGRPVITQSRDRDGGRNTGLDR